MLLNNKGFTLIEVLIASSVLFIVIMTFVPINSLLARERVVLEERFEYTEKLQEELQLLIWKENKSIPFTFKKEINNRIVSFQFTQESNELIKGCVEWKNVRNKKEQNCLYGYQK